MGWVDRLVKRSKENRGVNDESSPRAQWPMLSAIESLKSSRGEGGAGMYFEGRVGMVGMTERDGGEVCVGYVDRGCESSPNAP